MSQSTNNTPIPEIVAASTPNDVIRAAVNNPALSDALSQLFATGDVKGLLQTRTFWAAILTPVVSGLAAKYAMGLDPATVGAITTGATTLVMIVMRRVTRAPVSGLVTK